MRKQRDGEDTKQRVLSAAEELFAKNGFAGTSLGEISKLCGISDGLILHHFTSKRNLYRQVQEKLAGQYADLMMETRDSASTPLDLLRQTILTSFNFWKQDFAYQRISDWAFLEGQTEFTEKEAAFTAGLARGVAQLQEKGLIDDRYSPVVLLTMVIGPIKFWLRYRERFKASLELKESLDELDDLFISQLIRIVSENSKKTDRIEK
ncbi:MAG: TetR/AcrR family transcriptional regulator [Leptolinea sp.]|jgi:AcrR family transcriptional regulator|nr:TetR/AcrR family transcriptional regulator [Leptolinea sp.]